MKNPWVWAGLPALFTLFRSHDDKQHCLRSALLLTFSQLLRADMVNSQ